MTLMIKCKFCSHETTFKEYNEAGYRCGNPECPTHNVRKSFRVSVREEKMPDLVDEASGEHIEMNIPEVITGYIIPERVHNKNVGTHTTN